MNRVLGVWDAGRAHEGVIDKLAAAIMPVGDAVSSHFTDRAHGVALVVAGAVQGGLRPAMSRCGRYVVTAVGPVGRRDKLKSQLGVVGVDFDNLSDWEIIAESISRYGVTEAIQRLPDSLALIVLDCQQGTLWLVRDRIGERPLFYELSDDTIVWSSSLKAVARFGRWPRDINPVALADVLARGYVRGSRSIYRGVRKLRPGAMLKVSRQGSKLCTELSRWWDVRDYISSDAAAELGSITVAKAADTLDDKLTQLAEAEMTSGRAVGAFLSGGVDSSLIVATMQKVAREPVHTFTVALDDPAYDESVYALEVAKYLGTEHVAVRFPTGGLVSLFEELSYVYDEPFGDSSAMPTILVLREAGKHLAVAVSGDGGDELFGGYTQYLNRDSLGLLMRGVPPRLRSVAAGLVTAMPDWLLATAVRHDWPPNVRARLIRGLRAETWREAHELLLSSWGDPESILAPHFKAQLAEPVYEEEWPVAVTHQESQMAYDTLTYLPDDGLVKVGYAAASVPVETRSPLLSRSVVEFALRLPLDTKIQGQRGKYVLKELLSRYVPSEVWERPKQGFAIPVSQWLRTGLRPTGEELLADRALVSNWFDAARLERIWREHQRGTDHGARLWRVLVILQWLRVHS